MWRAISPKILHELTHPDTDLRNVCDTKKHPVTGELVAWYLLDILLLKGAIRPECSPSLLLTPRMFQ
jgi:hypothetical protein